jgi:hypothetical protein
MYGFKGTARLTQSLDHQAVEISYGFLANARLAQSLDHHRPCTVSKVLLG